MRRFESINVIPFIDIMLVLLAIVLTTATFVVSSKLDINVPKSSSEETINNDKVVEIAIDKQSIIYYDETKIDAETLKQKLSLLEKTTPINVRVDSSVGFGKFIEVLDLFKQFQLDKFSIITKQEN
ncbi:MAG TPA: biopolymer transporter ExbD [Leucothrix sp.]|nr:biopolymer transporter ExbD [Leucothrix sp.]